MRKRLISIVMSILILISCTLPVVSAQEAYTSATGAVTADEARQYLGTMLDSAMEILTSPDIGSYTPESCAALEQAVGEAYGVYYNPDATAEELTAQADVVKNAIFNMQKPVVSDDAQRYLSEAIATAQTQVGGESDYTPDSYAVYYNALAYALHIQQQGKTDEEFVAAADALASAMDALVPVDTSLDDARAYLWTMMNSAYSLLSSGEKYTTVSVNRLEEAIASANAVYYNSTATAEELEAATDNVKNAISSMSRVVISEDAVACLTDAIAVADAEVGGMSDYTADSWQAFADAYREAERVLNTGESDTELIAAAEALLAAVNALVPVDKELVEARASLLLLMGDAVVEQDKYTPESLAALEVAVSEATVVYYNDSATLAEINIQIQKLKSAISGLVTLEDAAFNEARAELFELLENAKAVEGSFTAESLDNLNKAISMATDVLQQEDASLEEIRSQTDALQKAWDELEEVILPSEAKIRLGELISEAEQMAASAVYEYETFYGFNNALNTAKEDYNTVKDDDAYNAIADILKGAMDSLMAEAREVLGEHISAGAPVGGNYTNASYQNLLDTIENARLVFENEDASFEEINEQISLIIQAHKDLVRTPISDAAKQTLWDVVKKSQTEVGEREDYTPESWSIYSDAYSDALETYYYGQSDEEYYLAAQKLQSAMDALAPVTVTPPDNPTTPDEIYVLLGDVDGDGKVTVKDATFIQKCVAGLTGLEGYAEFAADANGDGLVNVKDATEIQKSIAGLKANENIGRDIRVPVV